MQQGLTVVSERGTSVLCSLRHAGQYFARSGQSQQFAIGSLQNHDLGPVASFQLHELLHLEFEGQDPDRGEKGLNLLLNCRVKC